MKIIYLLLVALIIASAAQSTLIVVEIRRLITLSTTLTIVQISLILQYVQLVLVVILAVTLQLLNSYMTKTVAKDDPIQLPQCLNLMILFNDLQKVFF